MPTILIKKTGEEPGAASLAVTVPVEQVQQAEARATSAYQRRARLPGFRKGKAPAALVKKQFAEDIRQQTLEDLIRESWKAALAQEALKPVADPHIHNLKWDAGAGRPVTFEFAREVGDFESLEALRKVVREDVEKEAEREADAQLRRELIDQIVQANRIVAPRPLVERALAVYAQAYGIPEDRWPDFAQEFRPVAEAQVRRDLILDWVVEHHGLRATAAELEQKLEELAARRGTPVAELRAALEKAKRLRDLERGLTEEKVFTFLLSQSTVEQT